MKEVYMKINVVNRHTTDVSILECEVVDIMQSHGSALGNPFYNDKTMTREEQVKAFERYLWDEFAKGGVVSNALVELCAILREGGTVNLVCVCAPKPCHGDVIKRCLEWMLAKNLRYTGVGSRDTPSDILVLMELIARGLSKREYILRSGGALGADSAFERGAVEKEIYYKHHSTPESEAIAALYHPNWGACKPFARSLHGRNSFQVLGATLNDPSDMLICWTPDGCLHHKDRSRRSGGTGTAISIASMYHVHVSNLRNPDHYDRWFKWVQSVGEVM
jgi:hypothetical protein